MQTSTSTLPANGTSAIEILLNDHQIVKRLLNELTSANGAAQAKQAFEQLKAALTLHNATEENLVYPAISQVAGKHMKSQHLYHETAAADVLMFEIDVCLKQGDTAGVRSKAQALSSALLEHIQEEEESAFPALQKHASPEQQQMLNQSVLKFRQSLQYQVPVAA